jgi:hypothetical protein
MAAPVDSVHQTLDQLEAPVDIFFRDDDAGWEDGRLLVLLDLFAHYEVPIDLAAIPCALSAGLSRELLDRMDRTNTSSARQNGHRGGVHIHQHGYAHLNHERQGRKCEFGPSRDRASQREDIQRGRLRLQELMGPNIDSIFTPPWNRCTIETGECLVELGLQTLSRESSASPLGTPGLTELPVTHDWFAHRKGVRLAQQEWMHSLASKLEGPQPVGIMLHHAIMDEAEMRSLAELLAVLAAHPNAGCRPMREFLKQELGNASHADSVPPRPSDICNRA